jgi:hypothetical protein
MSSPDSRTERFAPTRSAYALTLGARGGILIASTPEAANTASNAPVNLASRSRIRTHLESVVVEYVDHQTLTVHTARSGKHRCSDQHSHRLRCPRRRVVHRERLGGLIGEYSQAA